MSNCIINLWKQRRQLLLLAVAFMLLWTSCMAQDIQYSQFYANVLYLNPAFAGSAHAARAIFHQRVQWPGLDAKFITSHVSIDNYFKKYNSGVGLMVYKDWQGNNTIASTEAALQYSYQLSVSPRHTFRAGIQASYVYRSINYSVLQFPDQYSDNGYLGSNTSQPTNNNHIEYLDLTSGGLFYTDKYWLGISYAHMTEPNQSFYDNQQSRLPVKLSFTGGYKINLDRKHLRQTKNIFLTPTFQYKLQGKSDQVDVGVYFLYDYLITGIWYRGIPFLKQYNSQLQNNESMVLLAGCKIYRYNLSITYSYDFTVSRLYNAHTAGSHELNITYLQNIPKRKIRRKLPCPDFD